MTKKTVYQRIIRAAQLGTGVRLSKEDAKKLALNANISHVAEADDTLARSRREMKNTAAAA